MKKMKLRYWFATGLVSLSTAAAAGYGPGEGYNKFMRFFDTNADGSVTLDEFNASAKARFDSMDSDGSASVTDEEFNSYVNARRARRQQQRFEMIDINKDGKVSRKEYVEYMSRQAEEAFDYLDKDSDGYVNATEHERWMHAKQGYSGGGKRIFRHIDANGDGVVTQAESFDAWSRWFERIDANGDKVVTSGEVQAYRERKWNRQ